VRQITTTTVLVPATATPPAGAYDLTVLETVKNELRIPDDVTTDDVWLQRAITRGSAAISMYCNRVFATETIQDVIYLPSDNYPYQVPGQVAPLRLSRYPVQSVTSVVVNEGNGFSDTLNPATDFILDGQKGELIRLNTWTSFPTPWDGAPTTVVYVAGYPNIPPTPDLEQALLIWIAGAYDGRTRDRNLKAKEQPSLGRTEYWVPSAPSAHFPPEIAELLLPYRDMAVQ
jgi:uncharacterized phiE125 gp8 family phage protein